MAGKNLQGISRDGKLVPFFVPFLVPLYALRLFIYFQLLSEKVEGGEIDKRKETFFFIFGLFYDLNKIFFFLFSYDVGKKELET